LAKLTGAVTEPDFVITGAGHFVGLRDLPGCENRCVKPSAKPSTPERARSDPSNFERFVEQTTAQDRLEGRAAEDWHRMVSRWIDKRVGVGKEYHFEENVALPIPRHTLPTILMHATYALTRLQSCERAGVARTCATLVVHFTPDEADLARLTLEVLGNTPKIGKDPEDVPTMQVDVDAEVITEVDGLIPHVTRSRRKSTSCCRRTARTRSTCSTSAKRNSRTDKWGRIYLMGTFLISSDARAHAPTQREIRNVPLNRSVPFPKGMTQHIGIVGCSAEGAALLQDHLRRRRAVLGTHAHPEVSMHTLPLAGTWSAWAAATGRRRRTDARFRPQARECRRGLPDLPANTMHEALPHVVPLSPLPWLHIADAVAEEPWRGIQAPRHSRNALAPREQRVRGEFAARGLERVHRTPPRSMSFTASSSTS